MKLLKLGLEAMCFWQDRCLDLLVRLIEVRDLCRELESIL